MTVKHLLKNLYNKLPEFHCKGLCGSAPLDYFKYQKPLTHLPLFKAEHCPVAEQVWESLWMTRAINDQPFGLPLVQNATHGGMAKAACASGDEDCFIIHVNHPILNDNEIRHLT